VRLVEKLVFGRYCVDRNGDHFDLQEAALDWLITDVRRQDVVAPSPQQKAMAELLGTDLALSNRQLRRTNPPTQLQAACGCQPSLLEDLGNLFLGLDRHQVHSLGDPADSPPPVPQQWRHPQRPDQAAADSRSIRPGECWLQAQPD
jgi:hypothetical protein